MATTEPATELLLSAAKMYYLDGLEQRAIADILGVSRSTVSRLLTAARERGVVRISVDPYDPRDRDLERRLTERLGLRQAVVVKAHGRSAESVRRAIGYFAAPAVDALIRQKMTIGVAGGRTLGALIGALEPSERRPDVTVVQLMGHIDPTASRLDAPELTRTLAQRLGGPCFTLNAPAFAHDGQTRDVFLAHEHIRLVQRHFAAIDLALVGIGSLDDSVFLERGALSAADYESLRRHGAVGEIGGRFFDRDGQECATEYRDRVISIDLDELRRRSAVVGVINGTRRAAATLAAIRGGLLTALVVDQHGAEAVLAAEDAR